MTTEKDSEPALLTEAELAEMALYGIKRRPIDSFHVGPFRYSNMKNAVAQAKRELSKYSAIAF